MKEPLVSRNGFITSAKDVLNRALLFGDGFFESYRFRDEKIVFGEYHRARIANACAVLRLNWNKELFNRIEQATAELALEAGYKFARGRVTIFRSGTGLYLPDTNDVEFIVQLVEGEEQFQLNRQGLMVDIFNGLQKPVNILSGFKTLNALPFVMASLEKKERGLDELLILNTSNRICEAITSSVFCVKGELLLTPALSEGCVDGVMRKVILNEAPAAGFRVSETSLTTLDLFECDELFITNAARGIQWIVGFRNKRYFNKTALQLTSMLNELVQ